MDATAVNLITGAAVSLASSLATIALSHHFSKKKAAFDRLHEMKVEAYSEICGHLRLALTMSELSQGDYQRDPHWADGDEAVQRRVGKALTKFGEARVKVDRTRLLLSPKFLRTFDGLNAAIMDLDLEDGPSRIDGMVALLSRDVALLERHAGSDLEL